MCPEDSGHLPAALVHQARKRFGQNFLHDPQVIQRIVRAIAPRSDDNLIEIGPGMGALTEPLLEACPTLRVIELDRDLIPGLRTRFFRYPGLQITQGDALEIDFARFGTDLRIVGNLPYNISTPLIFHLLQFRHQVRDMVFMLQKEVVERLAADPGSSDYGRLSVMAQYEARVESLFLVGPGAFKPAPKVWSAIVRLRPYAELPFPARNRAHFEAVVKQAFSQRRKTLRNVLKPLLDDTAIRSVGVDPELRPERISLQDYVRLADVYTSLCESQIRDE